MTGHRVGREGSVSILSVRLVGGPPNPDVEPPLVQRVACQRVKPQRGSRLFVGQPDTSHALGYWKSLLMQVSQAWWDPPVRTQAYLAKITEPVLFWCGDRGVFCPPEQSLEMYRLVKTAELAVIPNADHFTMWQQIDVTAMILLNFMKKVNT